MNNKDKGNPGFTCMKGTIKRYSSSETIPDFSPLPNELVGRLSIKLNSNSDRWLGPQAYFYYFGTGEIEEKESEVIIANLIIPQKSKLLKNGELVALSPPEEDDCHHEDTHSHDNWDVNAPFAFPVPPGMEVSPLKGKQTCAYAVTTWENVKDFSFETETKYGPLYLTPLIMVNGMTCYCGTYKKEELDRWAQDKNALYVAINGPIELDPALQVLVTYSAYPMK